jgi:serine protease inhibitor
LETNQITYNAELSTLDFADPGAAGKINGWVKDKTKGLITEIIDHVSPMDMMFLVNAVYFKGKWSQPFDKALTKPGDFTISGGKSASVPMMEEDGHFLYGETPDFQTIRLPYGDGKIDMLIFLPKKGTDINTFIPKLTTENWTALMQTFSWREGKITLPRFKVAYSSPLNDPLSAMGMGVAFDGAKCDFSGVCPGKVFISTVQHKAFMEVNEEGTEAAAVTSIGLAGAPPKPMAKFNMVVDRSFFCAIRDHDTGLILFMGRIMDPSKV